MEIGECVIMFVYAISYPGVSGWLACRKGRLFASRGLSLQVVLPGNQVSACAVGQDGGLLFTTTPRKVK